MVQKKSPAAPRQFIDGKTYACTACKNGHRVRSCNHGRSKPIAPTAAPGRPSSGSQKRRCECPKECNCRGNCKCTITSCVCTQRMYLICLVSQNDPIKRSTSPLPPVWKNEDGQAETLKSVWADASGQQISDIEAERRQREKEQREQKQAPSGCCGSKSKEPKSGPSGCRHLENIKQENIADIPTFTDLPEAQKRCSCGPNCECIYCSEHPNNLASRQYNASQLNFMSSTDFYMPSSSAQTGPVYAPVAPMESCTGGSAMFRLTMNKPHPSDIHQFFPQATNGDLMMSYPIEQNVWPGSPNFDQQPDSFQSGPSPEALPDFPDNAEFDMPPLDPNMNWMAPQADLGMHLGSGHVDQIFHSNPSSLQVAVPNNFGMQSSQTPMQYDTFPSSLHHSMPTSNSMYATAPSNFVHTLNPPSMFSPDFSQAMHADYQRQSSISSSMTTPATIADTPSRGSVAYSPNPMPIFPPNFTEPPPWSQRQPAMATARPHSAATNSIPSRGGGSCCGGPSTDMNGTFFPSMPLSPTVPPDGSMYPGSPFGL
jgi:hypothetical protein